MKCIVVAPPPRPLSICVNKRKQQKFFLKRFEYLLKTQFRIYFDVIKVAKIYNAKTPVIIKIDANYHIF